MLSMGKSTISMVMFNSYVSHQKITSIPKGDIYKWMMSYCQVFHYQTLIIGGADPELPLNVVCYPKKNTKKLGVATFWSRPNHKTIPNMDCSLGVFTTPKW